MRRRIIPAICPAARLSGGGSRTAFFSAAIFASLLLLNAGAAAQTPAQNASPGASPPAAGTSSSKQLKQTRDQVGKLPSAADLRPGGAVSVTARRADLIQGSSAIYSGDVVMDSDTLKLDGDRLELKQFGGGQYLATLTGAPAHMSHPGAGADNPPMTARAKTITYDSRNGIADLVGDAFVTKGEQNISAETIHYNVSEKGIMASGGGEQGRVHIVIPPAASPPAPAAAAPAAAPATSEPPP